MSAEIDVNLGAETRGTTPRRLKHIAAALWTTFTPRGEEEQVKARDLAEALRVAYRPLAEQVHEVLQERDRQYSSSAGGARALVAAGLCRWPYAALVDAARPVATMPVPGAADWHRLVVDGEHLFPGQVWASAALLRDLAQERAHVGRLPPAEAGSAWLCQRFAIASGILPNHEKRREVTIRHVDAMDEKGRRRFVGRALHYAQAVERRARATRVFQTLQTALELGADFQSAAGKLLDLERLKAAGRPAGVAGSLEGAGE